jgi:tetratricopeptide (TPR) repeat protein
LNYLIASYNIAFYVAKTILPLNLNPMYEVNTGSHGKFVYGPIFLLITLVAAFIICRKSRLAIFAVFFYLVHIIPLSNIVQVGYSFSAVLHFLYVALLGILLCLVMSYRDVLSSLNKTNLFMPVSFVLIIILSILSFQYTQVWGQSRTLLEYAIELDPENRFARTLIGLYHRQQGNFQEAEKHYKELVRLYPDYEGGYYGLGLVYRSYGRHAEAIEYFSKALEHTQKRADLPLDRGILLMTRGDFAKAEKDFSLSLQNRYPNLALAYFWRSVARRRQGNYAGAIDDLLKAAADNQEDFSLKICLLELFLESGQITDAGLALISVCQQAFRNPQQWPEHLRIISEPSFAAFIQRLAPYRNYFRYQFNWYPF